MPKPKLHALRGQLQLTRLPTPPSILWQVLRMLQWLWALWILQHILLVRRARKSCNGSQLRAGGGLLLLPLCNFALPDGNIQANFANVQVTCDSCHNACENEKDEE